MSLFSSIVGSNSVCVASLVVPILNLCYRHTQRTAVINVCRFLPRAVTEKWVQKSSKHSYYNIIITTQNDLDCQIKYLKNTLV